jgi:hypothetical protein
MYILCVTKNAVSIASPFTFVAGKWTTWWWAVYRNGQGNKKKRVGNGKEVVGKQYGNVLETVKKP